MCWTGEDRLWESKFCIPFQPQKQAWNKWHALANLALSCGVVWSHTAGTLSTLSEWGFNRCPPNSSKTPQLRTSKLVENCGKTEILHLQPYYGICWSHEIKTLPNVNKGFIQSWNILLKMFFNNDIELRATDAIRRKAATLGVQW